MSGTNVTAPPKRSHHAPLSRSTSLGDAFEHPEFMARIKQAVPKHMSPDRMVAVFIQSVKKTPKLREVDVLSLLGAFISVASVGLEPNTALQHAHIIPFEKNKWNPSTRQREKQGVEVNIIFGYQGLLELVYRSGLLRSVHADVVWKADDFDFWYGSGSTLRHKPVGGVRAEGEMPLWGYTHANMKGDAEMFEVMPMADILRIRDATQAYSSAVSALDKANKEGWKQPASYTEAPWVKHFVPMAKKTVFRAAAKWLPKSIELASAIHLDEAQERGAINYGDVIEGTASILDGSLDAVTDEHSDRAEVDVGAAFSTQESRQAAPATQARSVPVQAAQKVQPTAQAPGFAAYLVDEWGEMVGEEHANAMTFANALREQAGRATSLSALLEANTVGIEDASAANSAARRIIEGLSSGGGEGDRPKPEAQQSAAAPGPEVPIPLPENGRGAAWPPYVKAAKESLAALAAPFVEVWAAANLPTILRAPAPQRLLIVKATSERCAALGVPVPPGIATAIVEQPAAATAPAPAAGAIDSDKKWADQTVDELAKLTTIDEIRALAASFAVRTRMSRLRSERNELWKMVEDASSVAMQRLGPPAEPEDSADGPPDAEPGDPGYS